MFCPKCKSKKVTEHWNYTTLKPSKYKYCQNCKHEWIDKGVKDETNKECN